MGMKFRESGHPATMVFLVALVVLGYATLQFAWLDTLAGFEDDSVSYVILGQWMSPWFDAPDVIVSGAAFEKYPPLFPFLLAITGASHHWLWAHILVVLFHLAACWLTYRLGVAILQNHWAALTAALLFGISPSVWLNILGILSETQYQVISLGLLLYWERTASGERKLDRQQLAILTALLALLILTRSIGIAAVGAYGLWYLVRHRSLAALVSPQLLVPALAPLALAFSWSYLRPTAGEDLYAGDVVRSLTQLDLWPQLVALSDYWGRALVLYWSDANSPHYMAALLFGALALVGVVRRLVLNKLDGWYAALYLAILTLWPYPGQFGRFIHALLPLLVIHALVGLSWLSARIPGRSRALVANGAGLVMLALMLPTLAFFLGRASYQTPIPGMDFTRASQFYGVADLGLAEFRAIRNEQLRLDFEKVRQTTPEDALIMWYTPSYLRLFALRSSVRFPAFDDSASFARDIRASGATHVFLSHLHPRYTNESFNGLDALPYLADFTEVIWENRFPGSERVASMLLRIDREKLEQAAAR
jgi:hypothetical protein